MKLGYGHFQHQSYNSNKGIGKLFKKMFPDSEIVQLLTCNADKMTYIPKFGLAEFIKRDLFLKINKGPFVVMFDKRIGKQLKNRQAF